MINDRYLEETWWLLSRARGAGLVLRALIVLSSLAALLCTRIAADHTLSVINVPVVVLAVVCVMFPDSHIGLLVVLLIGTGWLVTVDEITTPWSIGVAIALTVFHAATAAATVAPPPARWTRAMSRRWTRRSVAVMIASAGTWGAVVAVDRFEVGSSAALIAVSLVAIALAAMWAGAAA